jgi:hypothetical protein
MRLHLSVPGIVTKEDASVTIYPNPVCEHLYITSESEILKVSMFNSFGTCIQVSADIFGNLTYLNTGILSPGLYVLLIETEKGMKVKKFTKYADE